MTDEHARRIFRELQTLARSDYGGNTEALLVVYGVEGLPPAARRVGVRRQDDAEGRDADGGELAAPDIRDADLAAVGVDNVRRASRPWWPRSSRPTDGSTTASYPPEMSLAEKVATMMNRRELNTRDRDFADVWVLSRAHNFAAAELHDAIAEVARHRDDDVVPLAVALADMPDRQTSYAAMLRRMAYQRTPPASWLELLADVRAFIDPLLTDGVGEDATWDPSAAAWTSSNG
jgi:hypothetical protein